MEHSHHIVTPNKDAERCETRMIQRIFTLCFQVFNFSIYLGLLFFVIKDIFWTDQNLLLLLFLLGNILVENISGNKTYDPILAYYINILPNIW